ncbi:armadillo repeat-containing protein 3-like [Saccoglossus kowalevskii]|uniref:Armadillo repeat-containing protein 3-like n=1 Tax=Saccoglossus kowalevskii TaxID=10224 RepID=A0ABM0M6W6_SACKO|nr:PREDICTED: armadillo repeat-containing protein 3-like [Saccoglossus kowalevskii]
MGKKTKKDSEPPPKDIFDPLSVESKQAATVVLMLDSPEEEVQLKACEALYKFAEKCEDNKVLLLELGAMPPLLKLICAEDKIVRRNATMSLGVMAVHPEVRKALRKTDFISQIIKLLAPEEDTLVHEFSSLCLAAMANEFTSKVQIFEHDGIEPLIRLLSDPDPDVQKNSVEAICLMLQDFQTKAAIRELGGLQPLLDLLKSEYPMIQELALVSLARATEDVENRGELRELGGLERLVEFIGNQEWTDLHVHALLVMSNCLEDTESMELIQSTGGLSKLLQFCIDSTLPDVQQNAAKAIAKAARNSENRKIFHEQEAEKTLIQLLETDNALVQAAACQALAIMSENILSKSTIGEQDGIGPLIKLLNSDQANVREAASLALANLTTSSSNNCSDVVDQKGVEPLIGLLGDSKEGAQANAAVVLTNMATDEIMRTDIVSKGIVSALTSPLLSSNTVVQSKAALAVAAFVCDADSRTEFRNSGGLPALCKLLSSGNDEVRRGASWAIVVCATDTPSAMEVCKMGGLEVLQEIDQSTTRQNQFSKAALDRLLDSNLPAKYALTGKLTATDIIQDGFYDAGQAKFYSSMYVYEDENGERLKPTGKFLTLEEYSKQEVDSRRPVLLVNTKEPESKSSSPVPTPSEAELKTDSKSSVSVKSSKANVRRKESKKEREEREERERVEAERLAEMQKQQAEQPPPWHPPADTALENYITEVMTHIAPLPTTREQVTAMAQFVSGNMGGPIERGQLSSFSYELPISQIKYDLQCNVLPLGKIVTGIHYHRALLFKVLCDRIAVGCTLVRGEYGRAWNEIMLTDDEAPGAPKFPPKEYIVDLVHDPGRLMRSDCADAVNYQKL